MLPRKELDDYALSAAAVRVPECHFAKGGGGNVTLALEAERSTRNTRGRRGLSLVLLLLSSGFGDELNMRPCQRFVGCTVVNSCLASATEALGSFGGCPFPAKVREGGKRASFAEDVASHLWCVGVPSSLAVFCTAAFVLSATGVFCGEQHWCSEDQFLIVKTRQRYLAWLWRLLSTRHASAASLFFPTKFGAASLFRVGMRIGGGGSRSTAVVSCPCACVCLSAFCAQPQWEACFKRGAGRSKCVSFHVKGMAFKETRLCFPSWVDCFLFFPRRLGAFCFALAHEAKDCSSKGTSFGEKLPARFLNRRTA